MKKIFLVLFIIILTSCVETKQRGFYFGANIDKAKNFEIYNFTKQDLINNFGYPSIEFDDGSWLYYSYLTKNFKILRPKLYKEIVLVVNFGDKNKISNYYYKELKNKRIIDNTEIREKDNSGFLNSLFNGLIITPIN